MTDEQTILDRAKLFEQVALNIAGRIGLSEFAIKGIGRFPVLRARSRAGRAVRKNAPHAVRRKDLAREECQGYDIGIAAAFDGKYICRNAVRSLQDLPTFHSLFLLPPSETKRKKGTKGERELGGGLAGRGLARNGGERGKEGKEKEEKRKRQFEGREKSPN